MNRRLREESREYEILLAHGGDEKHCPFRVKKLEESGFDYIALGHIHRPQALMKDRIIYAGALEPIDRNDVEATRLCKGRDYGSRGSYAVDSVCNEILYSSGSSG